MSKQVARILVLLVGATIALAAVGMGYGLWFDTITMTGELETGSVALAFVNTPGSPPVTPYTDDDHVVNNAANDPLDIGVCPFPIVDDDKDGLEGEDPVDGINNDGDGIDEDPVDGIDNDSDGLIDEDPVNGLDDDGDQRIDEDPPGKRSTCDPRSTAVWTPLPKDEDGDGLIDEDAADGLDNDGDGLTDEDGIGGWVTPFGPAAVGQDIGKTEVHVVNLGSTLDVTMSNPSVSLGNIVYSPTVYAHVINSGTIPVIVVDISMTLRPAYELWDRNGNGIIVDVGVAGVCDNLGGVWDECAAPLVSTLTGIAIGDVLLPGASVPIKLKVAMTPAAVPGAEYAMALGITGNQYNEP